MTLTSIKPNLETQARTSSFMAKILKPFGAKKKNKHAAPAGPQASGMAQTTRDDALLAVGVEQALPAAGVEAVEQAPPLDARRTTASLRPGTLKNAGMFLLSIANNIAVPWVKMVTDSFLQILTRLDTMKSNEEGLAHLDEYIKAFFYIIKRAAERQIDNELVKEFEIRVQNAFNRMLEISPKDVSTSKFVNANATQDLIERLKKDLNDAVNIFQLGLQIDQFIGHSDDVGFNEWSKKIAEYKVQEGDVLQQIDGRTFTADRHINYDITAAGSVIKNERATHYKAGGSYKETTKGRGVVDVKTRGSVVSKGDIDMSIDSGRN